MPYHTFRNLIRLETQASIPHDKIYAMRGLAADGEALFVCYEDSPLDLYARLMVIESQTEGFDSWVALKLSQHMIDCLGITPSMCSDFEASIQSLQLQERPPFLLKSNRFSKPSVYMVLSVDAWEDAAAVGRGIMKKKTRATGMLQIPGYLSEQWHSEISENDWRQKVEFDVPDWQDIVLQLQRLYWGSPEDDYPFTHQATRPVNHSQNPSELSEVDIASPIVWAKLCAGGLTELHQHRARLSQGARVPSERVIVDSGACLGRTYADVLPGDLISYFGVFDEALVIRHVPNTDYEYEITGFAYMYRHKNGHRGYDIKKGSRKFTFDFVFDLIDMLWVCLWHNQVAERLPRHGPPTDLSDIPVIEEDGDCISKRVRF